MSLFSKLPLPQLRFLQLRFAVISMVLLLLVQAVSYFLVQQHIDRSVIFAQRDALRNGESVLQHVQAMHAKLLMAQAQSMSKQAEFLDSLSRGDLAALQTLMNDEASKAGASLAVYADNKFQTPLGGSDLLRKVLADLSLTASSNKSDGEAFSRILVEDWQAFNVVAYPILHKGQPAWIILGEPVNEGWLADVKQLSQLNATLVMRPAHGAWKAMRTTLNLDNLNELSESLTSINAEPTVHGKRSRASEPASTFEADLQDSSYAARLVNLSARAASDDAADEVGVVILDSTTERVSGYQSLKISLFLVCGLGTALVGMVAAAMGQSVSRSVRALTTWARNVNPGQYSGLPKLKGSGEVADLAAALDGMRKKIREREADILNLAYRDNLTHLPNREKFRANVQKAVAQATHRQTPLSILMFDLNRFKHVNDILGHDFGDRLLRLVAQRLKEDVIDRDMELARLGGDEFAVLIPGSDASSAKKTAKLIHQTLIDPISLDDQTIDLSAGIGVASFPAHATEAEALMNHCEVAMYAAKQQSSNTVIYNPKLDSGSQDSLSLLTELRQALDRGELRLYFQPKVNLLTGAVIGAEALVRWQHPQRGMVPPTQFIPFAEQTGFVRSLTQWMIDETAHMWRIMRKQGTTVKLSVNLSARDLLDQHLPEKIERILTKYRVHQGGMVLEITESATMDDPERALGILERLHALGIKLSIDDFGTGYSSLAYLKRLPVDELKIDKSFVMNMERDIHDAKIVRSTIDLAHNLGLNVVAEGLENIQSWKLLHGLRCNEGQGYYIAKPMPAEEFVRWTKQWSAPDVTDVPLSTAFAALL